MIDAKKFTKSDLKTGMIVTYANGEKRVVYRDVGTRGWNILRDPDDTTWANLDDFANDLTCSISETMNIVKVESPNYQFSVGKTDGATMTTLWERVESKRLTVSQIEELLGYSVEIVSEV